MMETHTIMISNLDDFEAEHIAQILSSYKTDILAQKIEAFVQDKIDNGSRVGWYDKHLIWHEEIMSKVKWYKE